MSVTTPIIPTFLHEAEIQYGNPTHEEVLRKLIQNYNYLGALIPVGAIIWVQLNQVGVTAPAGSVWQLCDGSEITLPDSPLKSIGINLRYTPNLLGRFPRMAVLPTTNPQGGSSTFNLAHDHGASTGFDTPGGDQVYEADGNRRVRVPHGHVIEEDLVGVTTVDCPAWYKLVPYMKIA